MGHASINITKDTYMKDVNKEAASRLGKAIFGRDLQKKIAQMIKNSLFTATSHKMVSKTKKELQHEP